MPWSLKIRNLLIWSSLSSLLWVGLASADDWAFHESRFSSNRTKIQNLTKEIHALLESRKHAHSSEEMQKALADATKKHAELVKTQREQEAEIRHVMYKHPERGTEVERKYSRAGIETLEQMEKEVGVGAHLERLRRLLVLKYKMRDRMAHVEGAAVAGVRGSDGDDPSRIPASSAPPRDLDIMKPIKLKK